MKRKPDLFWILVFVFGLGVVTTPKPNKITKTQSKSGLRFIDCPPQGRSHTMTASVSVYRPCSSVKLKSPAFCDNVN